MAGDQDDRHVAVDCLRELEQFESADAGQLTSVRSTACNPNELAATCSAERMHAPRNRDLNACVLPGGPGIVFNV